MGKYLMLGKYSSEAIKGITPERTKKVTGIIEGSGGKVDSMLALLGRYDLAFVVDFPGTAEAVKASAAIAKTTGIGFTTCPAISVEKFDKLAG